jgi:23S rRNA pseudouridine2605 synthase
MARSERPSKKKTSSFGKRTDAEKNFLNKKKTEGRNDFDRPKRSFSRDRDDSARPSRYGKPAGDERKSYGKRDESSSERPRRSFSKDRPDSARPSRYGKPAGDERKSFGKRDESSSERPRRFSKPFEKREEGTRPFNRSSSRPFGNSRSFDAGGEKPKRFSKSPYPKKEEGARPFRDRNEGFDADKPKRFSKEDDKGPFKKEPRSFSSSSGPKKFSRPFEKEEGEKSYSKGGFDSSEKFEKQEGSAEKPFRRSSRPFEESGETPKKFSRDQVVKKPSFIESKMASSQPPERPNYKEKPKVEGELIRLNKFMANSGVGSRREADEFIKMGLVTVNGVTITEMGHKVKSTDDVRYEGKRLKAEKPVYVLLNKPKGFITTTDDPQERNTVMNLVSNVGKERIYPVGRLDRNTTGLLLLTNDGELADKLTHPSYKAKKIYKAELDKPITKADFQKIQDGVHLEEGKAMVDDLAMVSDDKMTIGIEIHIGWNRVVRRIFESLGYQVVKLDRVVYAGLDKKELSRGQWRFLRPEEVVKLKHFGA